MPPVSCALDEQGVPPDDKDTNLQVMFQNIFKWGYTRLPDHAAYSSTQRKPVHWHKQVEATETEAGWTCNKLNLFRHQISLIF